MSASVPLTATSTPIILLLSLAKESFWDEQYANLIDQLSSKATLKRVTNPTSAINYLTTNTNPTPTAILITDPALTKRKSKFEAIRRAVVDYARGGGTVVIGTHFNSFVRPLDTNRWLGSSWGLPWTSGDYHRTTVRLNTSACDGRFGRAGLPAEYSQKAVFLKNVSGDAAVYLPSDESRVESRVFAATPVDDRQTPVAFAKVGNGWLGYVGDVNSETESDAVIVAMCGL